MVFSVPGLCASVPLVLVSEHKCPRLMVYHTLAALMPESAHPPWPMMDKKQAIAEISAVQS
jgi:hypothetical protein